MALLALKGYIGGGNSIYVLELRRPNLIRETPSFARRRSKTEELLAPKKLINFRTPTLQM